MEGLECCALRNAMVKDTVHHHVIYYTGATAPENFTTLMLWWCVLKQKSNGLQTLGNQLWKHLHVAFSHLLPHLLKTCFYWRQIGLNWYLGCEKNHHPDARRQWWIRKCIGECLGWFLLCVDVRCSSGLELRWNFLPSGRFYREGWEIGSSFKFHHFCFKLLGSFLLQIVDEDEYVGEVIIHFWCSWPGSTAWLLCFWVRNLLLHTVACCFPIRRWVPREAETRMAEVWLYTEPILYPIMSVCLFISSQQMPTAPSCHAIELLLVVLQWLKCFFGWEFIKFQASSLQRFWPQDTESRSQSKRHSHHLNPQLPGDNAVGWNFKQVMCFLDRHSRD